VTTASLRGPEGSRQLGGETRTLACVLEAP
jgi:hypothetical protein